MRDENLEFKFASSHKKSVQGMIAVEGAGGRYLWSWDSLGEIRVWDTKVRIFALVGLQTPHHRLSFARRSRSTRRCLQRQVVDYLAVSLLSNTR